MAPNFGGRTDKDPLKEIGVCPRKGALKPSSFVCDQTLTLGTSKGQSYVGVFMGHVDHSPDHDL